MNETQLSRPEKNVIRAIARYHYLTSQQVTRLLYSPKSGSFSRGILSKLTKEEIPHRDFIAQDNGDKRASPLGLWSLTAKGRAIAREMGLSLPPMKHGPHRRSIYYDHIIPVNDALIICELYARQTPGVELADFIHERDMRRGAERIEVVLSGQRFSAQVLADGWVDLRLGDEQVCIWMEADRDTEHIMDWVNKVTTIVAYYESGRYRERFGTEYLTVMVVVAPKTEKAPERHVAELVRWTEQILADLGKKGWGKTFRFTPVNPALVTPAEFFHGNHWVKPFDHTPQPLLSLEEAA